MPAGAPTAAAPVLPAAAAPTTPRRVKPPSAISCAEHRAAASAALAGMGSPAQAALPLLRQLADREPVDYIRRAARRLAQRLDTRATPPQD